MKIVKLVMLFLAAMAVNTAHAALVWTNAGDPYGAGLNVSLVYPDIAGKSIIFKCSDGRFYRFFWDPTKTEMPENAKAIYALVLTAMTTDRRVSLYYESTDINYITVQQANIHN